MAQMSVARALTKLKTVAKRMDDNIESIAKYGATITKSKSLLSSKADVIANHKDAKEAVAALIQSTTDLRNYYVRILLAIQESNMKTVINTDQLGPITVAEALILTQKVPKFIRAQAQALQRAAADASLAAEKYNKLNVSGTVRQDSDPMVLELLLAQPVYFFDVEDVKRAEALETFVCTELNSLINESNAVTMIELPEDV